MPRVRGYTRLYSTQTENESFHEVLGMHSTSPRDLKKEGTSAKSAATVCLAPVCPFLKAEGCSQRKWAAQRRQFETLEARGPQLPRSDVTTRRRRWTDARNYIPGRWRQLATARTAPRERSLTPPPERPTSLERLC